MIAYDLVKWVHILSSTVLFGTGIGTAFHMWMTYRRGTARELALAGRNTVLADWLFTMPAGLVQPATGLWLVSIAGWRFTESWLVATYVLYVLAFCCWAPVVVIQIRVARIAAIAARDNAALPERCHRLMWIWFCLGWPAFLALTAIFALMVSKPSLW